MALTRLEKLLEAAGDRALRKVVSRAREMDGLAARLRTALDTEAASHLVAANLREDGELAVVCSSSAWAARLRFESEALIGAARSAGLEVNRCSIKVARRS